ncbi:MAG: hypothetical protein AUI50_00270 [Crenarchaeota archaeon 13_1_40CM_2_52_14]|nr:MAG: hypothetical protein AUI97_02720 [Crenarchaeota archaeon 13_1_40CM_3_52_17]OLD35862.1 MAG: hypothetical protein AUI50_00270 [Crenarchaeota archaeon 13_1_40CM_2_52_14]OLE69949.1 MAG: hypothetical protein AUF78_08705 [archaeon 13_1_20CM_2_51_12]
MESHQNKSIGSTGTKIYAAKSMLRLGLILKKRDCLKTFLFPAAAPGQTEMPMSRYQRHQAQFGRAIICSQN